MAKVSIIGAGNVGATTAFCLLREKIEEISLIDILPGKARGKALDLLQSLPILNANTRLRITGSEKFEEASGSDVIIISAGAVRKPGMSREELLLTNGNIVKDISQKIAPLFTGAIIVATNPVDAMCWLVYKAGGFEPRRVLGLSCLLDSTRFRLFISQELEVNVDQVQAIVIGPHGEGMLPLARLALVEGVPLYELASREKINKIIARTVGAGAEIISLTGSSAYYAPAIALARMTKAILEDSGESIPCSAYLDGEYGLKDIFLGVPARVGRGGVKEVIELKLDEEEKASLHRSAETVCDQINRLKKELLK